MIMRQQEQEQEPEEDHILLLSSHITDRPVAGRDFVPFSSSSSCAAASAANATAAGNYKSNGHSYKYYHDVRNIVVLGGGMAATFLLLFLLIALSHRDNASHEMMAPPTTTTTVPPPAAESHSPQLYPSTLPNDDHRVKDHAGGVGVSFETDDDDDYDDNEEEVNEVFDDDDDEELDDDDDEAEFDDDDEGEVDDEAEFDDDDEEFDDDDEEFDDETEFDDDDEEFDDDDEEVDDDEAEVDDDDEELDDDDNAEEFEDDDEEAQVDDDEENNDDETMVDASSSSLIMDLTPEPPLVQNNHTLQHRPPLEALVDLNRQTILQDVDFLLDFAILGHPKTATTFLLKHLALHPEIQAYDHELWDLAHNRKADFVRDMYRLLPGPQYKRGYKAPKDIQSPVVLNALRTYWPHCRIMIGIRHPVLWFESFYNFRVREGGGGYHLPPANDPAFFEPPETCASSKSKTAGVCVADSRFHHHLALLGKTNLSSAAERALVVHNNTVLQHAQPIRPSPHKVFLYEITQLQGPSGEEKMSEQFRSDLSAFLNLHQTIPPIPGIRGQTPTQAQTTPFHDAPLNICDAPYQALRQQLMQYARDASLWIRTYFLQSPDVVVTSREELQARLLEWMYDPCEAK